MTTKRITMTKAKKQSIEPNIADLANGWLKNYNLDYRHWSKKYAITKNKKTT